MPGINPDQLRQLFAGQQGGILNLFNMFSGGALSRFTVFALGIMPYISASIIMQLMTYVLPAFENLKKEGEAGRRKITQYTRYGTLGLALFQSFGIAVARLRLGTSICLVVQRDPIQLAKQVASLDALSGGRFEFGVGGGWNALEIGHHGVGFGDRLAVMRERIEAMKRLWTDDVAEYHGKYVDFSPSYAWPKPAQKPFPRIHVAANAPKGLARVVRDGDGWFPMIGAGGPDASVFDHLPELRRRVAESGRDPERFEVSLYYCPKDEALLARCREHGLARAIFVVDAADEPTTLAALDEIQALVERVER